MDGWNTGFLLGWPIFRCYVSFREGTSPNVRGMNQCETQIAYRGIKVVIPSDSFLVP